MIFMLRGNLVLCKYLTFFRDIQLKLRHTNPKRELKACLCISLLSDSLSALIYIYKNIYVYIYILKRKKNLYKATSFRCKCTYALHISKPSCELCENLFAQKL